MQFILWHQFRGIELDMIDFLFEKVIYLYFSWWSLWEYVQKQHIESTAIAWTRLSDVTFSKNNGSNGLNLKQWKWQMATIFNFDIQTCQNTQVMPEMGSVCNN